MPDDLRTALHDAVTDAHNTGVTDLGELVDDFIAPCVAEYIADPVRRLAILNLIGDVESRFVRTRLGTGYVHTDFAEGEPVLVVRPREAATE